LATIADDLWQDAGVTPRDMDVVSVYDDYPVMAIVQLTDLGFALDYDLRALISRSRHMRCRSTRRDDNCPQGRRVRRAACMALSRRSRNCTAKAGERQVTDARLAVVSDYGMVEYRYGMCANAVVLERVEGGQ
jgi:hypothetical protein